MNELRLIAQKLTDKANEYTALKESTTDEELRQTYRDRTMACLECVGIIYERILEIQNN